MKRSTKLFLFGLLSLVFSWMPTDASALTMQVDSAEYNDWGCRIYVAFCDDGTELKFYSEYSYWGAPVSLEEIISNATTVTVPDTIVYGGDPMVVTSLGGYYSGLYLYGAPNLTTINLPSTIERIMCPGGIQGLNLYLQTLTPPQLYESDSEAIPNTTFYVPRSAYGAYLDHCAYEYSGWSTSCNVTYEGWEPRAYTINVPSAGQFGQKLLEQIEQWTDVDELIVIGNMNREDLALISRMKNIQKLDLSQTDITSIGGCSGLTRLETVLMPATVETVESDAFYGCTSLKTISLPNVRDIQSNAFYNCRNLQTVEMPLVSTIGSYAFYDCRSLRNVDLRQVTSIGYEAFYNCSAMTEADLSNVSSLGAYAFCACSSLAEVVLSNSLTELPQSLFASCDSLWSIELPASVKTIGGSAFYNTGLTSVVIPEGCTRINSGAFSNCPLETVSIPSTIESIGSSAFSTYSLNAIYCYVVSPIVTEAFRDMANVTLYVPEFSVNAYRLHDDWYHFNQILALEGDIEQLNLSSDFAIYDYNGLADKVDMTLAIDYYDDYGYYEYSGSAHLTINANAALSVGNYVQYQNLYDRRDYWDSNLGQYIYTYPYCTSLITQNEITADNMCTHVYMSDSRWNFISFPYDVNVSDIVVPEGVLWVIRKYSGENRAAMTGNTWQNMTEGMVLKAGEGYIFHCSSDEYSEVCVSFPSASSDAGTLFACNDVVKTLDEYPSEFAHNRSWNLVGNPYPAYFNIQEIEFDAPITVWNGNGYTAYSLLDDNYVLTPNEAFFVQRPTTSATMTFHKEGRMHSATIDEGEYAPSLTRSASASRLVYNFLLADADYTDRARLVVNEEAKVEYEANCDASKFMSSNAEVPQLYINEGGVKYAIDERPLGSGIISLGAYFGKSGEHTLSLASNSNEGMAVMLTDHLTGAVTDLTAESYTFTAEAGTDNSRFTIALANTTDIESGVAAEATVSEIYTLDGKQVVDTENLPAGVYLVKKGGEYVKHVVKE